MLDVQGQERNFLSMSKIYLDKDGYNNYLKELEKIKEEIDNNTKLISEYVSDDAYGDGWHDNFAYEQARQHEISLFYKYEMKRKQLDDIVIIDDEENNAVSINTLVKVLYLDDKMEASYKIVGDYKSDLDDLAITLNTPLGSALYKHHPHDIVSYTVNNTLYEVEILEVKKI